MNRGVLCLFYSQFDIEKGGEIIVQYPNGYLSNEEFIKISEYVVPKPELCNKSVSIKLGSSYLMGYPIYLTSKNYNRTRFQFNFSLIVKEESFEKDGVVFEMLLMKIAKTFEEVEISSGYDCILHNRDNIINFVKELHLSLTKSNPVIQISIYLTFKQHEAPKDSQIIEEVIVEGSPSSNNLMSETSSSISPADIKIRQDPIKSPNSKYVQDTQTGKSTKGSKTNLFRCSTKPESFRAEFTYKFLEICNVNLDVKDHLVPVFINFISVEDYKYYDISVRNVIESIDGVSFIKKIANNCHTELRFVKFVIYNLILNKVVSLVDIFQFNNIYRCSYRIFDYYNSEALLSEFIGFYQLNNTIYLRSYLAKSVHHSTSQIWTDSKTNYFQEESELSQEKRLTKDHIKQGLSRDLSYNLKSFTYGKKSQSLGSTEQGHIIDENIDSESLFTLYCELGKSENVKMFLDNFYVFRIDLHLLVAFGIYKRIIERVHLYGVLKGANDSTGTELFNILSDMLDGTHCMDEICCEVNKNLKEILNLIRTMQGFNLIYK